MKKLCLMLLLVLCLVGCTQTQPEREQLQVVATLFPQYDFARVIAGDCAQVTLLLPPGAESHSYEPTPSDFLTIQSADVFLYTGAEMEPWVERIVTTQDMGEVADVSSGIETHAHDPHIWTSPKNAVKMVNTITDALCMADSAHADTYRANAARYCAKLTALDAEFKTVVAGAKRTTMIFGGRFAFRCFAEDYGLTCYSAYDSCAEESEPGPAAVAALIDRVKTEDIPAVYYEELVDPKLARTIADETGAELLLFHTCHNVTQAELDGGVSYLSLMQQNLEHLRKGLN